MAQTTHGALVIAAAAAGLSYEEYLAKLAAGLKRCRKCHDWKPITAYATDRSRHDALKTVCRDCDRTLPRPVRAPKPPKPPKAPKPKPEKAPKPIKVKVPKSPKPPKPAKVSPPKHTSEEIRLLQSASRKGIAVDQLQAYLAAGLHQCPACLEWKPLADFAKHPYKCAACRLVKVRKSNKGQPSAFKGRKHSDEAKAKMSAARKGKPSPKKGIPRTPEDKQKISEGTRQKTARGAQHYNYKNGAAMRALSDRRRIEYQDWRNAVFARDSYTCQKCGDATGGNLRAHHIQPFSSFPALRFDVTNGITLCHTCHELEHFKPESIRNQRKLKRGEKLFR